MLLPAHAVDDLSLLGHVLHNHVDKQLGILGHDFLMRRGDVGTLVGQGIDVYRNHSFGGNIIDNGIFRQYKQIRIEIFDFCEFLALLPNFLKDNLAHVVGIIHVFQQHGDEAMNFRIKLAEHDAVSFFIALRHE